MKILIYGAGVIGSLYAARLSEAGEQVTLLARGQRATNLASYRVVLQGALNGYLTRTRLSVIEALDQDADYDLAIVPVRRDQVTGVLPALAAATRIPTVLFMHNHAGSSDQLESFIGRGRVLLGFPGAAGSREGSLVRCTIIPQQPTTLGELDGRSTSRIKRVASAFRQAGFRVVCSRDMDGWLKTHAVLVTAVSVRSMERGAIAALWPGRTVASRSSCKQCGKASQRSRPSACRRRH